MGKTKLDEISNGAFAMEAMTLFQDRMNAFGDIKVSRNEPCPCGAKVVNDCGEEVPIKFKKCCGKD